MSDGPTLTLYCPHILTEEEALAIHEKHGDETEPRKFHEGDPCEADIDVECEYNAGETYGSDADGNRGIWVPSYISPGTVPDKCPDGHEFTPEEKKQLEKELEGQCKDYEFDTGDGE